MGRTKDEDKLYHQKWRQKKKLDPEFIRRRKEYDRQRWLKNRNDKEKIAIRKAWYTRQKKNPNFLIRHTEEEKLRRMYEKEKLNKKKRDKYESDEKYRLARIEYSRWYRKIYGKKVREKDRSRWLKLKQTIVNKYGGECICCSESNIKFLSIDHKYGGGVAHRKIAGIGSRMYRWIIKNDFPNYLQIMCYNCNMGRAKNKNICPHKETLLKIN